MAAIRRVRPGHSRRGRAGRGSVRRGWWIARRSPLLWWTGAALLGALTAGVVMQSLTEAVAESQRWGRVQQVWVARRTVSAGVPIKSGDVGIERRPRALVPAGSLTVSSSPVGRAPRITLSRGEVLLGERLAGGGVVGLAAAVPEGRLAVGVPTGPGMPPVRPGDRVDVLATFEVGSDTVAPPPDPGSPDAGTAPIPSFAVAIDAEVLDVSAATITVAVDFLDAPRVAFAVARGAVTLAVRGPGRVGPSKG